MGGDTNPESMVSRAGLVRGSRWEAGPPAGWARGWGWCRLQVSLWAMWGYCCCLGTGMGPLLTAALLATLELMTPEMHNRPSGEVGLWDHPWLHAFGFVQGVPVESRRQRQAVRPYLPIGT